VPEIQVFANTTNPVLQGTDPFPFCVIDNLLPAEMFATCQDGLPGMDSDAWVKYENPLELKYALNDKQLFPTAIQKLLDVFYSPTFCQMLPKLLGLPDEQLYPDPLLLGAGVHRIPRGGKLDIHLDHNRNPDLVGMERRVNAIFWFHSEWDPEWGGDLELWSESHGLPGVCAVSVIPHPNRLALFKASDKSFHGHPEPLGCPDGKYRTSLALYYYSKHLEDMEVRPKVKFVPIPGQKNSPELDSLRQRRADPNTSASVWRSGV